jgi:uncharacterized protein YcfJ
MTKANTRLVAAAVAGALLLTACAAPQGGRGSAAAPASNDPCSNAVGAAVAGALVGALLGAAAGNSRRAGTGAVVGGLVGALACMAINSQSRQTKSAAVVEQEYANARGALPPQPQLVSYQTRVDPDGAVRPNSDVRVNSSVEVVRGAGVPIQEVKEEIVLYDTNNKEFKRGTKQLSQGSGGSYETSWQFKLPDGVTQGRYRVETLMYVNGQLMAKRDNAVQLVLIGDGSHVVAAR